MSACHVHKVPETGCVDCLQDSRDCLQAEVDRLRGTLTIAGLEPAGEKCVRCSWVDGKVLKQCWPCKRIDELEEGLQEIVQFAEKHSGWWARTTAQKALDGSSGQEN